MVYSGKHLHCISEILIDFDWFHHWLKGDYVQQRLLEICFEMMPIRKGIFSDPLWSGIVKTIHANFGAQRKRSKSNHSNLTSSTFTLSYHVFSFQDWGKMWSSNGLIDALQILQPSCNKEKRTQYARYRPYDEEHTHVCLGLVAFCKGLSSGH